MFTASYFEKSFFFTPLKKKRLFPNPEDTNLLTMANWIIFFKKYFIDEAPSFLRVEADDSWNYDSTRTALHLFSYFTKISQRWTLFLLDPIVISHSMMIR